jgi:hypothetical protein
MQEAGHFAPYCSSEVTEKPSSLPNTEPLDRQEVHGTAGQPCPGPPLQQAGIDPQPLQLRPHAGHPPPNGDQRPGGSARGPRMRSLARPVAPRSADELAGNVRLHPVDLCIRPPRRDAGRQRRQILCTLAPLLPCSPAPLLLRVFASLRLTQPPRGHAPPPGHHAHLRTRTATYGFPGSSTVNRPSNVPSNGVTVISHVSMTSTLYRPPSGTRNVVRAGCRVPKYVR